MHKISLIKTPYSKVDSLNKFLYETNYKNIIYKFYLTQDMKKNYMSILWIYIDKYQKI